MYHVVLILLLLCLTGMVWTLVQSSPRILSMVLPKRLTFAVGTGLLVLGVFSAFASAFVLQDPGAMLGSFVQTYAGLWFMLAISSGARGSYDDEQMLKRLFLMMILMLGSIVGTLYVGEARGVAVLHLMLITGGFWITANYLRYLDRGR